MDFFGKVAVLGAGLIGPSLAFALKKNSMCAETRAWSRSESTRQKCRRKKSIFDAVFDSPLEAVEGADIVVISTPTLYIPSLASEILPHLKRGAIVTDVGSVKGEICRKCFAAYSGSSAVFVGSHPMAGSEKIGVDFADSGLFESRPCFVVADTSAVGERAEIVRNAADTLRKLWEGVGMDVYAVDADTHDTIVARVSHLPHLVAGTLCVSSAALKTDIRPYSGPGFRDTTRVSSGSPEMWDSIIADNRAKILEALEDYRRTLDGLIGYVKNSDTKEIAQYLRTAKAFRDGLK